LPNDRITSTEHNVSRYARQAFTCAVGDDLTLSQCQGLSLGKEVEDMATMGTQVATQQLVAALESRDVSVRLAAALGAGCDPHPDHVETLVGRCAVESDFFVRDMLSWALIRNDRATVTDRLLAELTSATPQARSQALHTLSKVGDPALWPAITSDLLFDADDDVARAAWRTAAGLVPEADRAQLAEALATQLGRGGREIRMSLSRALALLSDAALPVLARAGTSTNEAVRGHAAATLRLIEDPDAAFDDAVQEATRVRTLRGAPMVGG
jgi:HEAT repeat protein